MDRLLQIEQEAKNRAPNPLTTRLVLGQYIVADPQICHGKLTFRGTRIFVADVLEMVAEGMDWELIVQQWNGKISRAAIEEAVTLAAKTFLQHAHEYRPELVA